MSAGPPAKTDAPATQDPIGLIAGGETLREAAYKDTVSVAAKYPVSMAVKVRCAAVDAEAPPKSRPKVYVVRKDCFAVAEKLARAGKAVTMLNYANNTTPGGPTRCKGGTQEEELFRRTNLCASLTSDLYPIDVSDISGPSLLHSATVSVIKGDEKSGYALLAPPCKVGVISCAAIALPSVKALPSGGKGFRHSRDADSMEAKMCTILETAAKSDADAIVLGAWGCGAFAGPVEGIVALWEKALASALSPPHVIFAIVSGDSETEGKLMGAFGCLASRG